MRSRAPEADPAAIRGLRAIREAATELLVSAGALDGGWTVRRIRREGGRSVVLDLGPADGPGMALEWMERRDGEGRSFLVGEAYAVAYRDAPASPGGDDPGPTEDVTRRRAAACRALAGAPPSVPLRDPGVGEVQGRAVTMTPAAVEAWLAPWLARGSVLADGWRLVDLHPSRDGGVGLLFGRTTGPGQLRLGLRPRDDARPCGFRSRSLDVTYSLVYGDATAPERASALEALAAELLVLLDEADRGIRFLVAPGAAPASDPRPRAGDRPTALNLAIPADCGQRCRFCSVREELGLALAATDGIAQALAEDIRRAGSRGARVLRINGVEPLNAPYLFDLLDVARGAGFDEFHTLSTCRPLADRAFAERYVAAMPERYRVYVPVYGSSAARHDAVTGAPGAFDEVMAAVANLRALDPSDRGERVFTTVLVRDNAGDLPAIRDLVRPLGRFWEVHLPFPNTSSSQDRYRDVAVSMTDAVQAAYPAGWWPVAELALGEILPCVALAHQDATGHALLTPRRVRERSQEPAGTFYGSAGFEHSLGGERADALTAPTVPCPHAAGCALAAICPQKVYALYAELFGLDELRPVTTAAMAALEGVDEAIGAPG